MERNREINRVDERVGRRVATLRMTFGHCVGEVAGWLSISDDMLLASEAGLRRFRGAELIVLAGRLDVPVAALFREPSPGQPCAIDRLGWKPLVLGRS